MRKSDFRVPVLMSSAPKNKNPEKKSPIIKTLASCGPPPDPRGSGWGMARHCHHLPRGYGGMACRPPLPGGELRERGETVRNEREREEERRYG